MKDSSDNENETKGVEMPFLQHLEELRWHLIRSAVAVITASVAVFLNKSLVFDEVIFAPKKGDFISFHLLCRFSEWLHEATGLIEKEAICLGQNMPSLQNVSMSGQFSAHIVVSLIAGFVVAFPYVFWEIWRFIRPALLPKEKKYTRGVVFFFSSLFLLGVLFGYFVIAPLSVNFLLTYEVSKEVVSVPTLSSYITTLTMIVLASGVIFELPLLVFFLTKIGLISSRFLRSYRKHAVVVNLIVAAIITPPDVFSQLLVTLPMLLLYEAGIIVAKSVEKKSGLS